MLESMIGKLDRPPIIMGHSAEWCVHPGPARSRLRCSWSGDRLPPTEGVKVIPLSEIKSRFPILKNPANRHRAVGFTRNSGTTCSRTHSAKRSLELYEKRYHPSLRQSLLGKRTREHPPRQEDTYDYHNDARPPLLFISGKQDHLFPPKVGALEREALQVQDGDGDRGVRWSASAARDRWVGGSRRLRPRLVPQARGGDDGVRPGRSGRS